MFAQLSGVIFPGTLRAQQTLQLVSFYYSAIGLVVAWASWRIWTFTVRPALYPDEPKQLPYAIPFIGHVVGFMKDHNRVFDCGREYFGNTREPFSLTIMGETIYVVASPRDIQTIYKKPKAISFDPFIQQVLANHGATPATIDKMFGSSLSASGRKNLMDQSHDDWKFQLQPGEQLTILQTKFLNNIESYLQWDNLPPKAILSSSESQATVSLWALCGETLLRAATRGFFGDRIFEIAPGILDAIYAFDKDNWKLNYQYPYFAAKEMYDAKKKGVECIQAYFRTSERDKEETSWIMRTLHTNFRSLDIPEWECASLVWMIFWVSNSNAFKLCFWYIAHLVHDTTLLRAVKEETNPAFTDDVADMDYLLEKCPLLESIYEEILRSLSEAIGARTTVSDSVVGDKVMKAGTKVLMPYRQLHLDADVFGSDARTFNATRFMENKQLSKSTNFRPFGGGSTICPGRFIVRREAYLFVAVLLQRYEIALDGSQNLPRVNERVPTGGIRTPRMEDDLQILLTRIR